MKIISEKGGQTRPHASGKNVPEKTRQIAIVSNNIDCLKVDQRINVLGLMGFSRSELKARFPYKLIIFLRRMKKVEV